MPTRIIEDAVYTVKEAAEQLRISDRHLRKLVKDGRLHPVTYVTGKHLFRGAELLRCLDGGVVAA